MAEEEKQSLAEDTLVEVSKDLAELLSNSVNMADKFFEIFFDPNPHLVTLELYDREGTRTTYQIPNRAMDKSVALSGNGSPEGVIEAEVGTLYIDEDKRELYIKRTKDSSMGWLNITPYTLDVYTDEFTYNYEVTGNIKLKRLIEYPEHLQVYADGLLLIPPPEGITYDSTATGHTYDYQISDDKQTLFIYKELPANTTIFVRYLDGMGALKGDTAIKVTVGETTTLNAGENAQVTETIDDESAGQTITLDFAIPRGATGNTGVHIGANPPEDPNQNIWLDTNASSTSTADFASMRIWDSGICNNLSGYNKVYDIKHSYYVQDAVEKYGDVYVTSNGVMTSLTDKGYTKYVKIPYKIGNLKGKSWYISGKCKLKKPQIDETPILLLGERTRLNGAIFARPFGFFFAARTGDVQDNDELHDNSGVKAEILYEFKEDELEEFYYELSFTVDGSLFVFAMYDKDTNLIGKRYWNGPPTIIKNSQVIYMHSTELLNVNVYPDDYIVIGAHIADEDGNVNRHSAEDEYNLRNLTLNVSNEDGVLEPAYSSNLEKSLTLTYPDGTTKNIKYYDCITGAKVADVAYKPIIDDYFNITGKGNIYLLDEQNKTFELPKPDLYGLIESLSNRIGELESQLGKNTSE